MLIRLLLIAALGLAPVAVTPASADAQNRARRAAPARTAVPPRAVFERSILQSDAGDLFASIRRNFPAEYNALIDALYRAFAANIRAPDAAARQAVAREQFAFYASLGPHLRLAPDAALLRGVRARLALLEGLQRTDPALCGQVAMHGNTGVRLSTAVRQLNGQAMVAIIDAAGTGRRAPVAERAPVTEADREIIGAAFAAADTNGDLMPLTEGNEAIAAAAPEQVCRYAITIHNVALSVPPAQGVKLAVALLQEAVGSPSGL